MRNEKSQSDCSADSHPHRWHFPPEQRASGPLDLAADGQLLAMAAGGLGRGAHRGDPGRLAEGGSAAEVRHQPWRVGLHRFSVHAGRWYLPGEPDYELAHGPFQYVGLGDDGRKLRLSGESGTVGRRREASGARKSTRQCADGRRRRHAGEGGRADDDPGHGPRHGRAGPHSSPAGTLAAGRHPIHPHQPGAVDWTGAFERRSGYRGPQKRQRGMQGPARRLRGDRYHRHGGRG